MSKSTILRFIAVSLLMFAAGWLAGRWALEREWSNPVRVLSEATTASNDGDPSPAAGTTVVGPLPLRKMREVMKGFTAKDPVIATVGAFARDDDDKDLHLVVENRGSCKATRFAGVAYGYDAWGHPSRLGTGKPYVAFDVKDASIDPGKKGQLTFKMKDPGVASLAVAQLDLVECAGGPTWKR